MAVGTVGLTLFVRTWLLLGLITPVYVVGSSMAPTLQGWHWSATCSSCGQTVDVDAEGGTPLSRAVDCPYCGRTTLDFQGATVQRGDRLWIDRAGDWSRGPVRWQPVVLICPDNGQYGVKRVAGLPGEVIELVDGDLFIDGERQRKSLAEQRLLRRLVAVETVAVRRWKASVDQDWHWDRGAWHTLGKQGDWLEFADPRGRPITDALPYNLTRSRVLVPHDDVMLSSRVRMRGPGRLLLRFQREGDRVEIEIAPSAATISTKSDQLSPVVVRISEPLAAAIREGEFLLETSTFDDQLLAAINGQTLVRRPLESARGPPPDAYRPAAVAADQLEVSLGDLRIWRDTYYAVGPDGAPRTRLRGRMQLGPDEYFVLGDNPAVSVDSRVWGPVGRRLLVGRPLGVR